jgi:hypothetical protein
LNSIFIAACVEYHQQKGNSPFTGVNIQCLFNSPEEAYSSSQAEAVGYTHLLDSAKQKQELAQRLEKRVFRDYPSYYEKISGMV